MLAFIGDDFTGSTDSLELLATSGLRSTLLTSAPAMTTDQLHRYDAIGFATTARQQSPDQIRATLEAIFAAIEEAQPTYIQYKTCSTFDSSPAHGSIGSVIDLGLKRFAPAMIPIVAAAPSLGRYTVFGQHFAKFSDGRVHRLDRHPSMSRHPITPMHEADLRLHLAEQTHASIALFDILQLHADALPNVAGPVLFDAIDDADLARIGQIVQQSDARFCIGSAGMTQALLNALQIDTPPARAVRFNCDGPVLVLSGSCAPLNSSQVRFAIEQGFAHIASGSDDHPDASHVATLLESGQSVIIGTDPARPMTPAQAIESVSRIADTARTALESCRPGCIVLAGGDTSGQLAMQLGVERIEYAAPLTRGAPICMAFGSEIGEMHMVFKGGQVGPTDLFVQLRDGVKA